MVVRAGGPPSINQLILAFVPPLFLFVGTLVTAARVADDLDDRFLREVRIRYDYHYHALLLLLAAAANSTNQLLASFLVNLLQFVLSPSNCASVTDCVTIIIIICTSQVRFW